MKANIKTISIGIPAFNEELNIGQLLRSLIEQKIEDAVLEQILVISDGSTDATYQIASKTGSPLVKVINGEKRLGQQERQNQIFDQLASDIVIIIEADTRPANQSSINELIRPFFGGEENFGVVSGQSLMIHPGTFFERILFYGDEFKRGLFASHRNGENIYCLGGHGVRAFSKKFRDNLRWPADVPEDAFTYLALKKQGLKLLAVPQALFYAKSVDNFSDRLKQCRKFRSGKKSLNRYFSDKSVTAEYRIPKSLLLSHVGKFFLKHPFWTPLLLSEMLLNRLLTFSASQYDPLYAPYQSSKKLNF